MIECDTYFIGYDAREHEAACVAAYSLQRRANRRTRIYILEHQTLRRLGLFTRPWIVVGNGQFYDNIDERPFSTGFSHSRFLVFHLARELKVNGPCMFVDCDWLFLNDPGEVMAEQAKNPDKIGVVSRQRVVEENSIKMDGMIQQNYERKLWSAMFTFSPSDALSIMFSPDNVNHVAGRDLHTFLDLEEEKFWEINPAWHYIPSLDELGEPAKGIHYSEFSPWLNPDKGSDCANTFQLWHEEKQHWLEHAARAGRLEVWRDLELDLSAARA